MPGQDSVFFVQVLEGQAPEVPPTTGSYCGNSEHGLTRCVLPGSGARAGSELHLYREVHSFRVPSCAGHCGETGGSAQPQTFNHIRFHFLLLVVEPSSVQPQSTLWSLLPVALGIGSCVQETRQNLDGGPLAEGRLSLLCLALGAGASALGL